jgi:peptide/nickel transport system permease protein
MQLDTSTESRQERDPRRASLAGTQASPSVFQRVPRWFRLPDWVGLLFSNWLATLGIILLIAIVVPCLLAPLITSFAPDDMADLPSLAPSSAHWFGTNQQGEDLFSQTLYGGRFSLFIGVTAGLATTILSVTVGMTAGFVGDWTDEALGVVTNIFLVIPQLPLLIVLGVYLQTPGPVSLIVVISMTGWAYGARILRSQTLSLKNRDFVQAAIISGESTWRVIFREIMPNMISLIASTMIFAFIGSIMAESGLEFLGIGDTSTISWGNTLYWAQNNQTLLSGTWWHFLFPGLALALTATACTFINYGVDTISNPRLRKITLSKVRTVSVARPTAAIRGRS